MPVTTLPGIQTPVKTEPFTQPMPKPELYPIEICPQQQREHASPDVAP